MHPKDYAPVKGVEQMKEQRIERIAKIERWSMNGLWFMAGVAVGTVVVGTVLWGF